MGEGGHPGGTSTEAKIREQPVNWPPMRQMNCCHGIHVQRGRPLSIRARVARPDPTAILKKAVRVSVAANRSFKHEGPYSGNALCLSRYLLSYVPSPGFWAGRAASG